MLINLFNTVRAYGIPVSVREFLDLLNALEKKIVFADWNEFYYLSRSVLVKDEKYFDKFDRAFDIYFRGIENLDDIFKTLIPDEWLREQFKKNLSSEDLKKIDYNLINLTFGNGCYYAVDFDLDGFCDSVKHPLRSPVSE